MSSVTIRPYRIEDAAAVLEAVQESVVEVGCWMAWCHPGYARAHATAWIATQVAAFERRTAFEFAIVGSDGRYLGGCGLNQIDSGNRRANLGYWVRSTMTRRGIATNAVGLVRRWAFANTNLIRLEIVAATGNTCSQRVAEKAGATREGILRNRLLVHECAQDAVVYSFIRSMSESSGA